MKKSLWSENLNLPEFETLKENVTTDVLIVGGGMCGILCALLLQQSGVDYLLVEGDRIGSGITGNTTAKITSQHGLLYSEFTKSVGKEKTALYLRASERAISDYRNLAADMDCDFEEQDSYVYSLTSAAPLFEEVAALRTLGFPAEYVSAPGLPFETKGAVRFPGQAMFHPLKFIASICKELNIREHTFVRKIHGHTAVTENAVINAGRIIIATHFPLINRHGSYFMKLYQHRSYCIALKNGPTLDGMYVDESHTGMSFRNYREYLLVGGGGHRTGKPGGGFDQVHRFCRSYFPEAREAFRWAAQDCMSLDQIPYVGHYSLCTPDLFVASGFNKWGMTSSMVAASVLRDMVCGIPNPLETIFSPQRNMMRGQLFQNAGESFANLLSFSPKRCTHLGCALKWNSQEHTWDCPCHGSRFNENGTVLDNPAMKDLS